MCASIAWRSAPADGSRSKRSCIGLAVAAVMVSRKSPPVSAPCADHERGRPAEMGQRIAAEGEALVERAGGEMDAAQQLARLAARWLMVAGDEIGRGHLARFRAARPQHIAALERHSQRDHRAGRQRHADIAADGGRVPDLPRRQQRVAAAAQQRRGRPVRRRLEVLELGDGAGRGNIEPGGESLSAGQRSNSRSISVWVAVAAWKTARCRRRARHSPRATRRSPRPSWDA